MSYDVKLLDASGDILPSAERFEEGGTYVVGGTDLCELNITYNYSQVFGDLVRELDGMKASDTLEKLRAFVAKWPDAKPYRDYWAPTPGNAVAAIRRLIRFAEQHPDGVWRVG